MLEKFDKALLASRPILKKYKRVKYILTENTQRVIDKELKKMGENREKMKEEERKAYRVMSL